jgi:mitogen-activated protein kinase 15
MSEEIENHVLERYEILKKLGRGAYGIVWKVVDKRTKKTVALKKVFEAFQNSVDAQRTYREVMYLQELNGHTNIVRLMSIIRAYNNRDLYLVFEYMETDLHAVIKAKILQPIHKQFVFYQLLKALKYIHTADLIHRDLKPSNLLINSECLIKVADFGLARSIATKDDGNMPVVSDYVATRWYRAPEILLGSQAYNKSVDMWSAGCILAELISGKVLFTGKSTLNQVELIIELLGFPNNEDIESVGSPLAWNILSNIKSKKTKSVTQMFGSEGKDALDLLRKLLSFNPNKRLTVVEALNHPYVKNFHCEEDEIVCKKVIKLPLDDNVKLSLKDYREAIYKDINEKIKRSKSPTQENLPKLNDKIKSISSLERAPDSKAETGTTTQPTVDNKVRKQSYLKEGVREARLTESSLVAEPKEREQLKVNRSYDFGDSKAVKARESNIVIRGTTGGAQKQALDHYKALEGKKEKSAGVSKVEDSGKWYRSVSPPGPKQGGSGATSPPNESSQQWKSQSKSSFKVFNASFQEGKEQPKGKKSFMFNAKAGLHKKTASTGGLASASQLKSPPREALHAKKDEPLRKNSSTYFFKKMKAKPLDEADRHLKTKKHPSVHVSSSTNLQPAKPSLHH